MIGIAVVALVIGGGMMAGRMALYRFWAEGFEAKRQAYLVDAESLANRPGRAPTPREERLIAWGRAMADFLAEERDRYLAAASRPWAKIRPGSPPAPPE